MLLGAAGISELNDADLEAATWLSVVFIVLPGVAVLSGLAILGWTSRNRLKVCGQIATLFLGLATLKSLFDWLGK